jgi:hypothetical protein
MYFLIRDSGEYGIDQASSGFHVVLATLEKFVHA